MFPGKFCRHGRAEVTTFPAPDQWVAERRDVFPVLLFVEFQVPVDRGVILAMGGDKNRRLCEYLFQTFPVVYQHIPRGGAHEDFDPASRVRINFSDFFDIIGGCPEVERVVYCRVFPGDLLFLPK